jgi:hypothetical protein
MGFLVTGLAVSPVALRLLASCYVEDTPLDQEVPDRVPSPGRLFITSSVLTSDAWMDAARAEDAAKARRSPRRGALDDDPHRDNITVVDQGVFDAFAAVAHVPGPLSWVMDRRIMITSCWVVFARSEG